MSEESGHKGKPAVGVVMLDTAFPRIKGDIGNPETFKFPVLYEKVTGAFPARVVRGADRELLEPFRKAAGRLEMLGVRAVTTSCGFLALFQKELAAAVSVPFFSSSLLQVPMARALSGRKRKVGVVTAHRGFLSDRHFRAVGVDPRSCVVAGMEASKGFQDVFLDGKTTLDEAACRAEVVETAVGLVDKHPEVGALVLECTNMPPYSDDIRRATGLPVFDIVTLVNFIHEAVVPRHSFQP